MCPRKKPSDPAGHRQLEIWWVTLEPTVGHKTQKHRPCVVLQNNVSNRYAKTVVVAPLLKGHRPFPHVVNIPKTPTNGLDQDRRVDLLQLRAVDISRLTRKQGVLETTLWPLIQQALSVVFERF